MNRIMRNSRVLELRSVSSGKEAQVSFDDHGLLNLDRLTTSQSCYNLTITIHLPRLLSLLISIFTLNGGGGGKMRN